MISPPQKKAKAVMTLTCQHSNEDVVESLDLSSRRLEFPLDVLVGVEEQELRRERLESLYFWAKEEVRRKGKRKQ